MIADNWFWHDDVDMNDIDWCRLDPWKDCWRVASSEHTRLNIEDDWNHQHRLIGACDANDAVDGASIYHCSGTSSLNVMRTHELEPEIVRKKNIVDVKCPIFKLVTIPCTNVNVPEEIN